MAVGSKTWWGREFLRSLEKLMDPGRLSRGRSYRLPHRRKKFAIRKGTATATMVGNVNPYFEVYETPYYRVKIEFERIPATRWTAIVKRLGTNPDWVTHLILGEVPPTIEEALKDSPVKLLPQSRKDIKSSCSCPDWANPCKHVAGLYYHVASLLDRDPLLLFEFRGIDRSTLMKGLSKSEFGRALSARAGNIRPKLGSSLDEPRYSPVEEHEPDMPTDDLRAFWRGTPLPREEGQETDDALIPALLLRREGDFPEFWPRENSFLDAMEGIYGRVAKRLAKLP